MKLTILGGGGFRVPLVYRALLGDTGSRRVETVSLYDRSQERLDVIATVLGQLAAGRADPPHVSVTTDLDQALAGADFVFSAVRVGGLDGRTRDERVALELGVLGQETTGPGGIAYGLRTIPVLLGIAERIRELAPDAYVINFTNPAGMITEALQAVLGDRVIGICDTPVGMGRRIATSLGLDPSRAYADYVGLNHLGWLRRLVVDGRDRLPDFLADERAVASVEEGRLFGTPWLRSLGAVPNEYLSYYYFHRDVVRSIVEHGGTRGEFLARQRGVFYAAAGREPECALELWREAIAEREASYLAEVQPGLRNEVGSRSDDDAGPDGGYEAVALAIMAAIARDEGAMMIVNVRNGAAVAEFDADAVVEIPALVDANGAHPLVPSPPDLHQLGLMQQVKAVERYVIEAATTGSPDAALKAFALHPLVDSVVVARELLRGYAKTFPDLAHLHRPAVGLGR